MTDFTPTPTLAVWFDIDDTLAYELDFCKSGFRAVAKGISDETAPYCSAEDIELVMSSAAEMKMNHYDALQGLLECSFPENSDALISKLIAKSVQICRNHLPDDGYRLKEGVKEALKVLTDNKVAIGIITDGRSVTQRNKLHALGLDSIIDPKRILISEEIGSGKEDEQIFRIAESLSGGESVSNVYIADNPSKDFYHPNRLDWTTIMIAPDRRNIHFPYPSVDAAYEAHRKCNNVAEAITDLILHNS